VVQRPSESRTAPRERSRSAPIGGQHRRRRVLSAVARSRSCGRRRSARKRQPLCLGFGSETAPALTLLRGSRRSSREPSLTRHRDR
jgi:hypothetical protein